MIKRLALTILPAFFAGTFIFAQVPEDYQVKVKIIFNSNPASVTIDKAALKYNKDFAYSFTFDDGKEDAYTVVYPYFSGGTIQENGLLCPGLTITDGCGNKIPFKGGLAINSVNSVGDDTHENTPGILTWNQIIELHQKGWNVFNHSYSHSAGAGTNYVFEISENTKHIKSKTGLTTTHFVVPSGDSNYVPVAFDQGMKAVYNQQSSFQGVNGIAVDGNINLNDFRLFRRFVGDEYYDQTNIREKVDQIAALSSSINHLWFTDFTHSVTFEPKGGSTIFSTFQNYMNYIENTYGSKGSDRMWMAPLQEVYEYLEVRNNLSYHYETAGDTVIVYLDFAQVANDLENYSITFKLNSPDDFEEILVEGAETFTFNGTGSNKLINLTWKSTDIVNSIFTPDQTNYCLNKNKSIVTNTGERQLKISLDESAGEKLDILILNNLGNILASNQHICNGQKEEIEFNLLNANLNPGIYIVKIIKEKSECIYSKKIVIH